MKSIIIKIGMKKKVIFGLSTLLIGILLGGITYYILHEGIKKPQKVTYVEPVITEKVVDTSKAFSEIVNSVSPAVINISTTKTLTPGSQPLLREPSFDFFNPFQKSPKKWREQSLGSGVIVSEDGYIVTNNHVVEKADEIVVTLFDRRSFNAEVVGVDPKTDIALVKINSRELPTLPWGNSEKLKVGEFLLAIGNPFGLSHTVTMGIVSAVGRANVGIADYENFIQTDAAINPGNSGGPLVNIHGELVGINTAIFSRSGGYQGIGFAVPSNIVRGIMEQLRERGRVVRGWLGVTIQDLSPELAKKFGLSKSAGALVSEVFKGSPAEMAGIQRGDVIVEFGGKRIENVPVLRNHVAQSKIGSHVDMILFRHGNEIKLDVVVAELPKEFAEIPPYPSGEEQEEGGLAGLSVTELTGAIARQLGVDPSEEGLVVVEVEAGPAQDAGIRKGDIIQEIDRKRVSTLEDWRQIILTIKRDETVVLFINRGGRKFYVAMMP
jgi:serine protease Do